MGGVYLVAVTGVAHICFCCQQMRLRILGHHAYLDVFDKLLVVSRSSRKGLFVASKCVSEFGDMHLSGFVHFHRFWGPVGPIL